MKYLVTVALPQDGICTLTPLLLWFICEKLSHLQHFNYLSLHENRANLIEGYQVSQLQPLTYSMKQHEKNQKKHTIQ